MLELRNSHHYATQNNTNKAVSTGDVVVVHDKDQPRGKWLIGKVEDLLVGADDHIRGAVVRIQSKGGKSTTLRRPVQRLYPLEIQCQAAEPEPPVIATRLVPDSTVSSTSLEQAEPRRSRRRRAAAVEADRRRQTWSHDLN